MKFPDNFVWGAATASYQIEGAAFEDGKGLSVWDTFSHTPDKIWDGQNGDVACDHYHRYREDVGIMREIGLQGYRMSLSWPRILPAGTGKVNEKGLDFYDRLVDELLAAGVQPWVTLFHWDYPYELYRRGGWLNPDSSDWFAEYTRVVVEKLSDRVTHWMTLNEPQCFIGIGHHEGRHAPGLKLSWRDVLYGAHNALLSHGKAVQTIRAYARKSPTVGFAPVGVVNVPATDSRADIDAARQASFSITEKTLWNNTWWSDPVILGQYPADGLEVFGADAPAFTPDELKIMNQPLDFYGANIYSAQTVRAGADGKPEKVRLADGYPHTAFHWKVVPSSLYWGATFLYERYKSPIVVTENGMSGIDWVSVDGKVHDPQRIDFLHRYLSEFGRAGQDGVPIAGYFQWSLMDNFEWGEGYKERFGMVHVDYATGQRTLKDSAYWYKELIANNGANL